MRISLIGLLLLTSQFSLSQDNNWPEITLGTYNYDSKECQPLIVSDGSSNLIYPCRNKNENKKFDISAFLFVQREQNRPRKMMQTVGRKPGGCSNLLL